MRQPTAHPIHENWRVELFRQLLMLPTLGSEQLKLLGETMYQVLALPILLCQGLLLCVEAYWQQ